MINRYKSIFTNANLKLFSSSDMKIFHHISYKNNRLNMLYHINKFNFVRNTRSSKKLSLDPQSIENFEKTKTEMDTSIKKEINVESSREMYESEEKIPLENENISIILDKFHYRGKLFQIESSKTKFDSLEEYVEYYNFLTKNLYKLHHFQLEKLIRAMCYYQIKEEKNKDILTRYLNSQPNNTHSSLFVVYVMNKLESQYEDLMKTCFKIISENGIVNSDRLYVIPFIWAISEFQVSNNEINAKIDEFIKEQINFMNEYVK